MASITSIGGGTFSVAKGSATLLRFKDGDAARIEIPAEVAGVAVTSIAAKAFSGNVAVREILLPETVTVIGRAAFAHCTGLEEIRLPYGLQRIEEQCFAGCAALAAIYYCSMTGISAVMKSDPALREDVLPVFMNHIGEAAFAGCAGLARVTIPYQVTTIPKRAFEGCTGLTTVELHNEITAIGPYAFSGCTALQEMRVPQGCKKLGRAALEPGTELISEPGSAALAFARRTAQPHRAPLQAPSYLSSQMIPRERTGAHRVFYEKDALQGAIESYEIRHPSYTLMHRPPRPSARVTPARFSLADGVYRSGSQTPGRVRLMMVADLMARRRQQRTAFDAGAYDFDFGFRRVRPLLEKSDFAVGNLESTIAPSAPFNSERNHVNARPHLNAPEEFLSAVRAAGFDAVVNAQNHIYDSGTRGVFETLDLQNRFQLMHTGAFVSEHDQRYLLLEIGGIRVGVVSFLDGARQPMKRANFTKQGLETMFPTFAASRVRKHIGAARAAGAEFVIAYAHWGREYTTELTTRQQRYAQLLADAGADYIVGAHSHCIQPFTTLRSKDGRSVPCLFSGGNFLCDMNMKPPITRDTLILDVELERDAEGRVRLASNAYHPCRILEVRRQGRKQYAVFPTSADVKSERIRAALDEARARIVQAVGDGIAPAG